MTLYLVMMDDGVQGDPECSYLEDGVDTAQEAGDHRRQMMQFCGQQAVCARYERSEVMSLLAIVHFALGSIMKRLWKWQKLM